MIGTQWLGKTASGRSDEGIVVNRHCHRLPHLRVAREDLVVEVDVNGLEVAGVMRIRERVVGELLVSRRLTHIQEPGGVDGAGLQILEDSVLIWHDSEHYTI